LGRGTTGVKTETETKKARGAGHRGALGHMAKARSTTAGRCFRFKTSELGLSVRLMQFIGFISSMSI
jgi:hypothetical protein